MMNHMTGTPFGTATLASEVAALRAENAKLRHSLTRVLLDIAFMIERGVAPDVSNDFIYVEARAALKSGKGEKA